MLSIYQLVLFYLWMSAF